jgi:hypothetical protein
MQAEGMRMCYYSSEDVPEHKILEDGKKRFEKAEKCATALLAKIEAEARGVADPQLTVPSAKAELAQFESDLKRCGEWGAASRSHLSNLLHLSPRGADKRRMTFEDLWLPELQGGNRRAKRLDLDELRSESGRVDLQNVAHCLRLIADRLAWMQTQVSQAVP